MSVNQIIERTPQIIAAEIDSIKGQARNVMVLSSIEIGRRFEKIVSRLFGRFAILLRYLPHHYLGSHGLGLKEQRLHIQQIDKPHKVFLSAHRNLCRHWPGI